MTKVMNGHVNQYALPIVNKMLVGGILTNGGKSTVLVADGLIDRNGHLRQ